MRVSLRSLKIQDDSIFVEISFILLIESWKIQPDDFIEISKRNPKKNILVAIHTNFSHEEFFRSVFERK